jgi:segregation and condensation protein A
LNAGEGEDRTPVLALDGFNGPLDRLLTLARAHQVDLARIPIGDLVDQLAAALRHAPPATPLGEKGDWVVMASWLLQLRSRLLLPADSPEQRAAAGEARQLRERLVNLQAVQALATWLDHRPQLGRDVFPRGQPEVLGRSIEPETDVIEFLWASLALFDDDGEVPGSSTRYHPRRLELHSVQDARMRILRRLAEKPASHRLDTLLPEAPAARFGTQSALRRRSAWASTFVASLELAKQGDAVLSQTDFLAPIQVSPPAPTARGADLAADPSQSDRFGRRT